MAQKNGLSTKQNKAIAALLQSRTLAEAADMAEVGERTVSRWLGEPDFEAALRDAEGQAIAEAVSMLAGLQSEAVKTLQKMMQNARSESVRLSAARACLDFNLKVRELHTLEERIQHLEDRLL
jgi:hypothetical protein